MLDLLCLMSVCAHLMFSWSLSSRYLVHAFIVVIVVYLYPDQAFPFDHPLWCSDDELHCHGEYQGRNGTFIIPTSKCCQEEVLSCVVSDSELEILEVNFDKVCDDLWDLEEAVHTVSLVGHWPRGISRI